MRNGAVRTREDSSHPFKRARRDSSRVDQEVEPDRKVWEEQSRSRGGTKQSTQQHSSTTDSAKSERTNSAKSERTGNAKSEDYNRVNQAREESSQSINRDKSHHSQSSERRVITVSAERREEFNEGGRVLRGGRSSMREEEC
jgi:hypothetical protein